MGGGSGLDTRVAAASGRAVRWMLAALLVLSLRGAFASVVVPAAIRSDRFQVRVDGRPAAFSHAAENYYFLNFEVKRRGGTTVEITAPAEDYWAKGVEVQPWRENIRPVREGRVIRFKVDHPAKLSISRPGDHLGGAEMLYVFANAREKEPSKKPRGSMRYYGPGVYHENIDAKRGDRIYLADGAVVFGSINIWQVDDVQVSGRGVVVYDGPQNPADDDGWMHKKNWHVLVMDHAHHISVSGITMVTRSRTWMIQMKDSWFITFDNVKVIGGSDGNANQDGMDWLGGGDTEVRNSFFRAADDVFALQGNWDGYEKEVLEKPGSEVSNIRIESSVVSTSISNIVRVNWPHKTFDSSNFSMRDVDVMHMGVGGCGVPFALMELWADPDGHGEHTGYSFEDIRLEDWYSLVQILQPNPRVHGVSFKDVWAFESSQMVPSVLQGAVDGVSFAGVKVAGRRVTSPSALPLEERPDAMDVTFDAGTRPVQAEFTYGPLAVAPGQKVVFDASESRGSGGGKLKYLWLFGDGTRAKGKVVRHAMPDTAGTLQDGSGRFRVLLKVTDKQGDVDWAARPVVVPGTLLPAQGVDAVAPGVRFRLYAGVTPELTEMDGMEPAAEGFVPTMSVDAAAHGESYGYVFEGYVKAPVDGGYVFDLLARDGGRVEIDGQVIAQSPAAWPQVCGSVGNAVQMATGSLGLRAGLHRLRVAMTQKAGSDAFALQWQVPGEALLPIPGDALFHAKETQEGREGR